jgi:hypothetical protein
MKEMECDKDMPKHYIIVTAESINPKREDDVVKRKKLCTLIDCKEVC